MAQHEGEGHGMWRNVKDAFGGLFGSGMSDERRMEVEVMFGLIGFLAKSDGLITSYESEYTAKLLDELELNTAAATIAMEAFRQGTQADFNVEAAVARFTSVHKLGSDEMASLFESLLRLSLSDGRVYPRERMALERLAKAFGIPVKSLDQRLESLRR
jgi:DnaJ like chaperone protein